MSLTGKSELQTEIFAVEEELMRLREKISKLKQKLPRQEVKDYSFKTWSGKPVKLSQLFGQKKDLILIHNMGRICAYCTMWADGFNGYRQHLEDRAALVVNSPDAPPVQKKFATGRGWKFKMVSSQGTSFIKEMGFEGEKGDPWPGVSTFHKKNGKIYRVSYASFGEGDNFCAVWHLLDLLAEGRNGWVAKFKYK